MYALLLFMYGGANGSGDEIAFGESLLLTVPKRRECATSCRSHMGE